MDNYNRIPHFPLVILATFILNILFAVNSSVAMQLNNTNLEIGPYIKGGTVAWDQLEGKGGHKFFMAAGVNTNLKLDPVNVILNLEAWDVTEGLDDDIGIIPRGGYTIDAYARYYFNIQEEVRGFTYAGGGYAEWDRSSAMGESWTYAGFFSLQLGIGVDHERGIIQIGIIMPFATGTTDGYEAIPRFGFIAEGKIRIIRSFYLGLFYRYEGLEFEMNGKEYPDAKMTQSGLFAQYVF